MAERVPPTLYWANVIVLIAFGWLAILIGLTPVNMRASAAPSPDILFCVAAFLAIRRSSATPPVLVLLLGLLRDLTGGGPTGLGALTLLAAVEYLRYRREWLLRSFFTEIWAVAATIFVMAAAQLALLLLALTPSPPLEVLADGVGTTFVAYLIVWLIFRNVFRIMPDVDENLKLTKRAGRGR